jgi:hypothetical protein
MPFVWTGHITSSTKKIRFWVSKILRYCTKSIYSIESGVLVFDYFCTLEIYSNVSYPSKLAHHFAFKHHHFNFHSKFCPAYPVPPGFG